MHFLFIIRDSQGRLPDADHLRRLGFRVSLAALPEAGALPRPASASEPAGAGELALAAESAAPYGAAPPPAPAATSSSMAPALTPEGGGTA